MSNQSYLKFEIRNLMVLKKAPNLSNPSEVFRNGDDPGMTQTDVFWIFKNWGILFLISNFKFPFSAS